jgi:hypothetical protein
MIVAAAAAVVVVVVVVVVAAAAVVAKLKEQTYLSIAHRHITMGISSHGGILGGM